jgi:hypothetical protein
VRRRAIRRGVGEALADREEGGVRVRFGGGEGRERVAVDTVLAEQLDLVDDQTALGERARLVDAQDVDASEHLDRGQLLNQHATFRQPDDADSERHARQEHRPSGTIATVPATAPRSAPRTLEFERN